MGVGEGLSPTLGPGALPGHCGVVISEISQMFDLSLQFSYVCLLVHCFSWNELVWYGNLVYNNCLCVCKFFQIIHYVR